MAPIDLLHRDDLMALASKSGAPLVTIMMPTTHVEADLAQNPIRLKNLLRRTQDELLAQGYRQQETEAVLAPARALLDDERFWLRLNEGLAIFLSREDALIHRLPLELEELVVTGTRFHLRPIFPLVHGNSRFFLLFLSQNRVELYQGTQFSLKEIHSSEIPRSILDVLGYEESEKTLQMHSGVKFNKSRQDTIFHGHGTQGEDHRSRPHDALRRFFQQIDEGIHQVIGDDDAPMILAGVKYYLPIYRDVNRYRGLVDDEIVPGNRKYESPEELQVRAWEVISRRRKDLQGEAFERFRLQHNNSGQLASTDVREIISAAAYRRVDTLFIPKRKHRWGKYDSEENLLELHEERVPGDDDLYDLAAAYVYLGGGLVYVLDEDGMPAQAEMAAIFRYAPGAPAREEPVRRAVPLTRST